MDSALGSRRVLFGCSVLLLCASVRSQGSTSRPAPELVWQDAQALGVEGKGWAATAAPYDRLPAAAASKVPAAVWNLSHHSAGLSVRFVSDAPAVHARWTLTSASLAMPHMPATGVSGLDLYVRADDGVWRWVANGRPGGASTTAALVAGLVPARREWLLYLPLYNGVTRVELGVPAGHELVAAPPRPAETARPIVFYGTSITQGGCASRPGMAHVAILGRRLLRPTVNLGFSGAGKMELELATLLGEIDAAAYVIDCVPNMDAALIAERAQPFVRALRAARPTTPILLVEDRTWQDAHLKSDRRATQAAQRAALRAAFDQLVAAGVPALHYLPGETLLGDDADATVDGSHPNDLGFVRQADAMEAALRALLRPPHVVFVTGDDEYRSEITMPMIARILEQQGVRCTVLFAVDPNGRADPTARASIAGLEALDQADAAVFFLRWRVLPPEQLAHVVRFAHSRKPVVGLRTTTHAFQYPDGPEQVWNDGFGRELFGQKWLSHHGHDSSTRVQLALADHPILRGVAPTFWCRSWLYQVLPLVGVCTPLALGAALRGERADGPVFGEPNPVAWTRTEAGRRVFFTTLGHPQDFAEPAVRRLLVQGVLWALSRDAQIPAAGVDVTPAGGYDPPPTR